MGLFFGLLLRKVVFGFVVCLGRAGDGLGDVLNDVICVAMNIRLKELRVSKRQRRPKFINIQSDSQVTGLDCSASLWVKFLSFVLGENGCFHRPSVDLAMIRRAEERLQRFYARSQRGNR